MSIRDCFGRAFPVVRLQLFTYIWVYFDRASPRVSRGLEEGISVLAAKHCSGTSDWRSRGVSVSLIGWSFHHHEWPCYRIPGCRCCFCTLILNDDNRVLLPAAADWLRSAGVDSLFFGRGAPRATACSPLLGLPLSPILAAFHFPEACFLLLD
jgi:hypothetical protein